jgi:hypothetical protein
LDEIIGMLDERDDATNNEHIEEVNIVQIGDEVVDIVLGMHMHKNLIKLL